MWMMMIKMKQRNKTNVTRDLCFPLTHSANVQPLRRLTKFQTKSKKLNRLYNTTTIPQTVISQWPMQKQTTSFSPTVCITALHLPICSRCSDKRVPSGTCSASVISYNNEKLHKLQIICFVYLFVDFDVHQRHAANELT